MKKIMMFIVLMSVAAWGKDEPSNDFGTSDSEVKQVGNDELSWRFHVLGEIFILSSSGDKLVNIANERREWQMGGSSEKQLESNWRFEQKGLPVVALRHKWTLEPDGKISVDVAQFENIERGSGSEIKFGKLIKEEKIALKDFAPIDWPVLAGTQKLIVRLTPGLWQNDEAIDVSALPISGKNIVIYDRTGRLWADQISMDQPATYFGATTFEGSMFLSFKPFRGAKIIGDAKNCRIKIKNGKGGIYLQSETPFLPKGVKANVYGILRPGLRTERFTSVKSYSSSREEEFVKRIPGN